MLNLFHETEYRLELSFTEDPETGTIVWPNGVDFCPDVLYSLATGKPVRVPEPA